METARSIAIMKALADQSRLAIINSLLEQPQYVEEIAKRHALAPSTVSFHLKKLENAGLVSRKKDQYYVVFEANHDVFATTLREIVSTPQADKGQQDGRIEEYRRKILETFFRGGKLVQLPSQKKKRLVVLDRFAQLFEPNRRYTEREVTALIAVIYPDYCTIRRLMVEEGLIRRDTAGYWLDAPASPPKRCTEGENPGGKEMKSQRAAIKQACKQQHHEMGVYQLRNRITGKIFISSSRNLESSRNGRLFELRTGKAVFNRELQKDLATFGADSFEFSVLGVLEQPEPGDDVLECLAMMKHHWLEKLQPYGERGYHHPKK